MKYISTRLKAKELSFKNIVLQGLADDGGLYVPEFLPNFSSKDLQNMQHLNYTELFFEITKHFIGDEINYKTYQEIVNKSYQNFSHKAIAPLKQIDSNQFLLELFHGPTLAFKDFALQFLGNLLNHFLLENNEKIAIIGATSGDTGSAAIYGCMNCKNTKIFILHPHNKISAIQRLQMTSVIKDNVFNIAIKGNFDDCQNFVKKMFVNPDFLPNRKITAINSINFARIMAQIVYYFYAGLKLGISTDNPISFSVPTGNFGDIYAGFLAKKMGLPIKKLIIATNNNDILTRFINNNAYNKEQLQSTLAPSMDIQVSSNFERLLFDFYKEAKEEKKLANLMQEFDKTGTLTVEKNIYSNITKLFSSYSSNDDEIKKTISQTYQDISEIIDPHTATAINASNKFIQSPNYENEIIVNLATASAAKFPEAIASCSLERPQLPSHLKDLLDRTEKYEILENDLSKVKNYIASNAS